MGRLDMAMMTSRDPVTMSEHQLRQNIDRSLSRALFDKDFESMLLADPAVVLGDTGCTPQQQRDLVNIRASSLLEFARQAQALFWPTSEQHYSEEVSLAAAAAI
jgi:hypothetical protein